jgi:putative transposase
MDCALTLIARGRPVKRVCEVLGVARSNVADKLARPADWRDGRTARGTDDAGLVEEIRLAVADLPSYAYRRVWGLLRRQRENHGAAPVNAKRVYRVMRVHGLLMERRTAPPRPQRRHDGKVSLATRIQAQDRFINSSVRRCPEMQGQVQLRVPNARLNFLNEPNHTGWASLSD